MVEKVEIEGLAVPGCFFGGIIFFEIFNKQQKQPYIELLRICFNISGNPHNSYVFPYISSSNEVLLSIFHEKFVKLDLKMKGSTSDCKGVFVNSCDDRTRSSQYFEYSSNRAFPPEYQDHILRYNFPFDKMEGNCLSVQLSLLYLVNGKRKVEVLQYGCKNTFVMQTCQYKVLNPWSSGACRRKWTSAVLKLSEHLKFPDIHYSQDSSHDTSVLGFGHEVTSGSKKSTSTFQSKCSEDMTSIAKFTFGKNEFDEKNEWYKKLKLF